MIVKSLKYLKYWVKNYQATFLTNGIQNIWTIVCYLCEKHFLSINVISYSHNSEKVQHKLAVKKKDFVTLFLQLLAFHKYCSP